LNPIEEAEAYTRLANEFALTQEMVAKKLGKSRTAIANTLRLLKLSRNIKEDLISEKISMGHARALLGLENSKQMEILKKEIIKQDLTVRQTEGRVKKIKAGSVKKPGPSMAKKNIFIKDLEKDLARRLGTKVDISPKKNGGKLVVTYYSDDDLDRIQGLMGSKRK
jgi:ParB family chromosome partitioning protein